MEIRHLRTFLKVSNLLSFYKAAEQLHYAQSSVSAHIRNLEEELKVKLFDRLGKRVILTEAGERLRQYAQKMVELAEETQAAFNPQDRLQGVLTVRVPESFAIHRLPELIVRFRQRHPEVFLRFITCARESLARDLQKGVTDLAFLLDESIQSSDMHVKMLMTEPLVMVGRPDHILTSASHVATTDLAGQTLLTCRTDCSYRRLVEGVLHHQGVNMPTPVELNSVTALKACLLKGIGVAVLPRIAVRKEFENNRLVPIHWTDGPQEAGLLMIWHHRRWLSPILKAFMTSAEDYLASMSDD
jgi:DNA-binding transcriptional LysR family regulator